MLKLNFQSLQMQLWMHNLNTSHVKVKLHLIMVLTQKIYNLITSNVKVNRKFQKVKSGMYSNFKKITSKS